MTPARRALAVALAWSLLAAAACGGDRPAPVPPGPAGGLCNPEGFCWLEPEPFGAGLTAVALGPGGEAWAAGPRGAVLHLSADGWAWRPTGVPWAAAGVWAGGGEVLVAGEALLALDGERFVEVHRPPGGERYLAVHGGGARVVAVGTGGVASVREGGRWQEVPVPGERGALGAVHVLADGTAFACVREGGRVFRLVHAVWTPVPAGDRDRLGVAAALWASSADDLWVAGIAEVSKASGLPHLQRWDGRGWTAFHVPALDHAQLTAIAGAGPGDVWAIARAFGRENAARWDGAAWTPAFVQEGLGALAVGPDGAGLAVGEAGVVSRLAGGVWTPLLPGQRHALLHADAGGGKAWLATAEGTGPTRFVRVDSTGAAEVPSPPSRPHVAGLSVAPDGTPWTVFGSTLARFTGGAWEERGSGDLGHLYGVHAAAPDRIWLAGEFRLGRFDGAAFEAWPAALGFDRIWATGRDEAWAVGGFLEPHRFDGEAWREVPLGADRWLRDVWASAPDDVWVVGGHGLAARHDGERWHTLETGTEVDLTAVTGDGAGRVWISRGDGVVLEWDGERLGALESGSGGWLTSAAWDGALGLLVGGTEGVLVRAAAP